MSLVVITGGGRRLGKALALEFALKKWDVAIIYNHSEESALDAVNKARALSVNAEAVKADVRNKTQLVEAFSVIVEQLGKPDVLVNNAAIYPQKANLSEVSDELWDDTININLRGYFYCSKLFSGMANEGARIINIASLGAFQIWDGRIPYNVSKAGVIQLTKALARNLAPKISVNSISPGTIIMPNEPSPNDLQVFSADRIPMLRHGSPSDVFDAVWFFATCTSYITGQNISVDGGRSLVF